MLQLFVGLLEPALGLGQLSGAFVDPQLEVVVGAPQFVTRFGQYRHVMPVTEHHLKLTLHAVYRAQVTPVIFDALSGVKRFFPLHRFLAVQRPLKPLPPRFCQRRVVPAVGAVFKVIFADQPVPERTVFYGGRVDKLIAVVGVKDHNLDRDAV